MLAKSKAETIFHYLKISSTSSLVWGSRYNSLLSLISGKTFGSQILVRKNATCNMSLQIVTTKIIYKFLDENKFYIKIIVLDMKTNFVVDKFFI
jgi:hypothetical protein